MVQHEQVDEDRVVDDEHAFRAVVEQVGFGPLRLWYRSGQPGLQQDRTEILPCTPPRADSFEGRGGGSSFP